MNPPDALDAPKSPTTQSPAGSATSLRLQLSEGKAVSALLNAPLGAKGCLILAHGAGAGMTHPFMADVADGLGKRGVATLRYQFLYMEQGSRRPDPSKLSTTVVQAAVAKALELFEGLPLFAGGKSFGGRMTSHAQAQGDLQAVSGLVFFGFPLHAAKKPSIKRADHLSAVTVPMLFLQGSRDALAEPSLLVRPSNAWAPARPFMSWTGRPRLPRSRAERTKRCAGP